MHDGKYEPQAAFLRMKQDIENSNPQMWDLAAYRVPKGKQKHLRTPEWKIFPTYDFAHCLCDSIEGVTHSLCTTEFVQARESYEWLNSTLGVYEPIQREFGKWVYFPLNQNFFSFCCLSGSSSFPLMYFKFPSYQGALSASTLLSTFIHS